MTRLAALFVALFAAATFAQPAAPQEAPLTPEQQAVRTAMLDFVRLLDKATVDEAKAAFGGSDEEFVLVKELHGVMKAAQRVEAATKAKFPEEAKNRRMSNDLTADGMASQLEREPVTIQGDTATVGTGGDVATLKQIDGKWKVVSLIADGAAKSMMQRVLPALTRISNEIAADVEAGKFQTLAEVEQAAQQKMQAEMMKVMASGAATTQPAE